VTGAEPLRPSDARKVETTLSDELSTEEVINRIFGDQSVQYGLTEFQDLGRKPHEILDIFPKKVTSKHGTTEVRYFLKCLKRQEDIQVCSISKSSPEEIIRQLFLFKLMNFYGYPIDRIDVEKGVHFGEGIYEKPADIIVYQKDGHTAFLVIELKRPDRKAGIDQLKSYLNAEGSPIGVWSNGKERVILYRPYPKEFEDTLTEIPRADQTIEELLEEPLTLDDLRVEFDFKGIVLQLEELVLANSGEDEFQEIFKLIFAKLYDEFSAKERRGRTVLFRKSIDANTTFQRIEKLFEESYAEWPGIFDEYDQIKLTPDHLKVCVGPLERIRLMGANMRVMDDAFEYLVTKVAKGAKGQYFTPRYVIDMCVKFLNPRRREFVVDPACGSSGFLLHTLNWVKERELESNPDSTKEYASKYLFGIDFDHRMAKIARALMLIAGDGRSHVFKLNALNPDEWMGEDQEQLRARAELLALTTHGGRAAVSGGGWEQFGSFKFDVLMTNPPFAGEIREQKLLSHYELSKRRGKKMSKVERHILFIERCIQFLRPGGRMAIVLPQGIFNNPSLDYIREFVLLKARLVAVVGLHSNTFKPHTGTKTSVLIIQKWKEGEEALTDYPVFMASSKKGGKDSSGDYVTSKSATGAPIRDEHGNFQIDHDLDEVAESFVKFAKREGFEFWVE
jgi:type I restriction enzyme M protein